MVSTRPNQRTLTSCGGPIKYCLRVAHNFSNIIPTFFSEITIEQGMLCAVTVKLCIHSGTLSTSNFSILAHAASTWITGFGDREKQMRKETTALVITCFWILCLLICSWLSRAWYTHHLFTERKLNSLIVLLFCVSVAFLLSNAGTSVREEFVC